MNIPESAIRPFEPLGIPRLGIMPYASVLEILDEAFKTMNELGDDNEEVMSTEGIELFLVGCLNEVGATTLTISVDTTRCVNECDVTVIYMNKNSRILQRYTCPVWSDSGFVKSRWGT